MSDIIIECPACKKSVRAGTGIFAKKKVKCSADMLSTLIRKEWRKIFVRIAEIRSFTTGKKRRLRPVPYVTQKSTPGQKL